MNPKSGGDMEDASDAERQALLPLEEVGQGKPTTAVYVIGGFLIVIVIAALACQQEVMQSAESKGNVDKPSLTIWWNHTCLLVGLPLGLLLQFFREGSLSPLRLWRRLLQQQRWTTWRALWLGTVLAVTFYLPNLAWAVTLKTIWVPLVTATSRFDAVFVLLFSSLLAQKAPPLKQVLAVLACITGVVLISFGGARSDSWGTADRWAYFEVFISPCLSALYAMIFNNLARGVSQDASCLCALLALIGLCNTVLLWPVVPICHAAGLEHQRLSDIFNSDALRSIALNAALATIGNFSQMPATALTSPLFVSLGMLLIMPVTVLIDWLVMHHTELNAALICGSLAICVGSGYSVLTEASEAGPSIEKKIEKKIPMAKPQYGS